MSQIVKPPCHSLLQQSQPMSNMPNDSSSLTQNPLSPDILSVSSKKLCSYCLLELGSGAAMIIENLGLFYHIDCFKCSVCHTPIADGNIHGTDVRVRNSRLHCQNCFSNEEGVKFSCVWSRVWESVSQLTTSTNPAPKREYSASLRIYVKELQNQRKHTL